MSYVTLSAIIKDFIIGSNDPSFNREEYSYEFRPSQFMTETAIYGITKPTTKRTVVYDPTRLSKFNHALSPIKDDADLIAAIKCIVPEFESKRSSSKNSLTHRSKLVARPFHLAVVVTKIKIKKLSQKITPQLQSDKPAKKHKINHYFRFDIDSILLEINAPIVSVKEVTNVSTIKPVSTGKKEVVLDISEFIITGSDDDEEESSDDLSFIQTPTSVSISSMEKKKNDKLDVTFSLSYLRREVMMHALDTFSASYSNRT